MMMMMMYGLYIPGEPKKKSPPTTFVDITAMHGNFLYEILHDC